MALVIYKLNELRAVRLAVDHIRWNLWNYRLGGLGVDSRIYSRVVVHSPKQVVIGRNVAIAEFVHIWGGGGVTIGDNAMIAAQVVITSQTHNVSVERRRESVRKAVSIGENAWIGSGAIILPGISIGKNAVVAAGAVVTRNVADNAIVAGVPAVTVSQVEVDMRSAVAGIDSSHSGKQMTRNSLPNQPTFG